MGETGLGLASRRPHDLVSGGRTRRQQCRWPCATPFPPPHGGCSRSPQVSLCTPALRINEPGETQGNGFLRALAHQGPPHFVTAWFPYLGHDDPHGPPSIHRGRQFALTPKRATTGLASAEPVSWLICPSRLRGGAELDRRMLSCPSQPRRGDIPLGGSLFELDGIGAAHSRSAAFAQAPALPSACLQEPRFHERRNRTDRSRGCGGQPCRGLWQRAQASGRERSVDRPGRRPGRLKDLQESAWPMTAAEKGEAEITWVSHHPALSWVAVRLFRSRVPLADSSFAGIGLNRALVGLRRRTEGARIPDASGVKRSRSRLSPGCRP